MRSTASANGSTATIISCALACNSVLASRAIATWPFQNTRSPRCRSAGEAGLPSDNSCMSLSRGQATPAACSATCTSPEQSSPSDGLAAPQIGRAQEGFRHRDEIRRLGPDRRQMHLRNMPAGGGDGETLVLPRDGDRCAHRQRGQRRPLDVGRRKAERARHARPCASAPRPACARHWPTASRHSRRFRAGPRPSLPRWSRRR